MTDEKTFNLARAMEMTGVTYRECDVTTREQDPEKPNDPTAKKDIMRSRIEFLDVHTKKPVREPVYTACDPQHRTDALIETYGKIAAERKIELNPKGREAMLEDKLARQQAQIDALTAAIAPPSPPAAAAEPEAPKPEPADELPPIDVSQKPYSPAVKEKSADSVENLRAEAESLGILVDGRWGIGKLREAIEEAKAQLHDDDASNRPPDGG